MKVEQLEGFLRNVAPLQACIHAGFVHFYPVGHFVQAVHQGNGVYGLDVEGLTQNQTVPVAIILKMVSNKLFIQENKTGPIKFTGKLFSQSGVYRILHTLEQMKDGVIYLSFSRFQKVPFITIIKALGLLNDQEITQMISPEKQYDDIYMNLINSVEINLRTD